MSEYTHSLSEFVVPHKVNVTNLDYNLAEQRRGALGCRNGECDNNNNNNNNLFSPL